MVIRSTLTNFHAGNIRFQDMPLHATDKVQFKFKKEKSGNHLALGIVLSWWAVDNISEQLFFITEAAMEYLVETDGTISVEELYCLCNNSAGLLSNHYNNLGTADNLPLKSISILPLSRFRKDLLELVNWFGDGDV